MKKCIVSILAVILLLATTAQAAESRALSGGPYLYIDGTTATCEATYYSSNATDELKIILTLWCGESIVTSWSTTGYGDVAISETCKVVTGNRYDLVMSPIVNGVAKTPVSTSAYS